MVDPVTTEEQTGTEEEQKPVIPEGYVSPEDFKAFQSKMDRQLNNYQQQLQQAAGLLDQLNTQRKSLEAKLFDLENTDTDETTKAAKKEIAETRTRLEALEADNRRLRALEEQTRQASAIQIFSQDTGIPYGELKDARTVAEMYRKANAYLKEHPAKKAEVEKAQKLEKAKERVASGAENFDRGESAGGKTALQKIKEAKDDEFEEMLRRAKRGEFRDKVRI